MRERLREKDRDHNRDTERRQDMRGKMKAERQEKKVIQTSHRQPGVRRHESGAQGHAEHLAGVAGGG